MPKNLPTKWFTKGESSCLAGAAADEPVFVLRAQDILAPGIIREWAKRLREVSGGSADRGGSIAKAEDAELVATRMEQWLVRKIPD